MGPSVRSPTPEPVSALTSEHVRERLPEKPPVPPEIPFTVSLRRWTLFSFWAVAVCFGLPAWWFTTSVYQASLPVTEMLEWDSGKHMPQSLPVNIPVYSDNLPTEYLNELVGRTQEKLFTHFENTYLSPTLVLENLSSGKAQNWDVRNTQLSICINSSPNPQTQIRSQLNVEKNLLEVHLPSQPSPTQVSSISSILQEKISEFFQEEAAFLTTILTAESSPHGDPSHDNRLSQLSRVSESQLQDLFKRNTIGFKPASTYHLTFSLFTPIGTPSSWEIGKALDHHLRPLLFMLSSVANFTLDTQVQLHSHFAPNFREPEFDSESNSWLIDQADLNGFINSAEWSLNPSIGTGPTINFALYVPSPQQRPLTIRNTTSTGWIVPQWGCVHILNPQFESPTHLTAKDMEPAMVAFSKHLLQLLGIPSQPSSLSLQLASYQRTLTTKLTASACTTLGAIVRLIRTLPSIAVPNTVALSVSSTIDSLEQAVSALEAGKYSTALRYAQSANAEAERAFFDPSMVDQAYAPEEHKMAVYLPLLGPVSMPLVLALLMEVRRTVERKKAMRRAG